VGSITLASANHYLPCLAFVIKHSLFSILFVPYLTLSYLILPYLTLPYLTLPYLILPYLTLPYLTLPYLILNYLTLPYLTLPYITLPYLTLPYLSLPYLTLHHRWPFVDGYPNDRVRVWYSALPLFARSQLTYLPFVQLFFPLLSLLGGPLSMAIPTTGYESGSSALPLFAPKVTADRGSTVCIGPFLIPRGESGNGGGGGGRGSVGGGGGDNNVARRVISGFQPLVSDAVHHINVIGVNSGGGGGGAAGGGRSAFAARWVQSRSLLSIITCLAFATRHSLTLHHSYFPFITSPGV
jgi:hypothetical protein